MKIKIDRKICIRVCVQRERGGARVGKGGHGKKGSKVEN